jgi:cell division protein FtsL
VSTVAQSAHVGRARQRAAARPRLLGGGILWIALFAVLLAGVVAVNVSVLRLNLALDSSGQERSQLRADIARLRSELSSAAASSRIARDARTELGLVPADPQTMVYVRLAK